jgi:hypothetical protein
MADQVSKWPVRIKLEKPVEAHGEQLSQLVLNEPNGGDLMSLPMRLNDEKDFIFPTVDLASSMAKVPPSTIKALGAIDSLKVMKVVNPLALQCLETLEDS